MKNPLSVAFIFAALALGGCNSAGPRPAPVAAGPVSDAGTAAPDGLILPEGAGCSGAIARYRVVTDNDLSMGHVNRSVYDQIRREIEEASSACGSGQDGHALSLLHASKARHGYPG